jgi:hypothetical protein
MILYRDSSIITDEPIHFSRSDTVLIDTESKTVLLIGTAVVPLTPSLPKTEAEKITEYENLVLEIKNIWKLNNVSVHPLVISEEGVVTKNFLKYVQNKGLSKNLKNGTHSSATTNVSCSTQILGHAP